jgi:hypothetical protein
VIFSMDFSLPFVRFGFVISFADIVKVIISLKTVFKNRHIERGTREMSSCYDISYLEDSQFIQVFLRRA